jgi:hypothetical protein
MEGFGEKENEEINRHPEIDLETHEILKHPDSYWDSII